MAKDKAVNPATAHLKAEKAKALKKGKAAIAAQRNARLATRNPARIERSIAELRGSGTASGAELTPREKKQVEDLEAELARVCKAREALGDKAPVFGAERREASSQQGHGHQRFHQQQGKRRRGDAAAAAGGDGGDESADDEDLSYIPWPRDASPPIPEEVLVRLQSSRGNPNLIPLGGGTDRMAGREVGAGAEAGSAAAAVGRKEEPVKTVYEAKPQIRDLRKEAVRFAPSVVRRKIRAAKGEAGLVDEDEVERLEKEGYVLGAGLGKGSVHVDAARAVDTAGDLGALEEEERRFQSELRNVQMEDVEDEDA